MHTEQDTFTNPRGIVVRLLNGTLKGCEYHLSAGKTLFITTDESGLCDMPLTSFPEDSIFVPAEGDGGNFEIVVPNDPGEAVVLRELRDTGTREITLECLRPYQTGSLLLAVRREDQTWPDDLLARRDDDAAAPSPVVRTRRRGGLIVAAVGVATIAAVLMFVQTKPDNGRKAIAALAGQLANEPDKYQVLSGRDGHIHVLARNDRDAAWGRQSLVRLPSARQATVASYREERQRIARWLGEHYPFVRLHQLILDSPEQPRVVMSRQRVRFDEPEQRRLREDLLRLMPYAADLHFEEMDDSAVAAQAEQGIKKLAVPYRRLDNADSVTFVITGALDDGERQRIKHFIEEYDYRWNGGYVEFAMEMKDDWLKGKSLKYGQHGYVKIAPGHWYFPKP
ncbi:PrgH/EprH family type III secretion apparatus protein [Martelella alba]|uniref:PrgH/EprH family type III secretion apparatus protein n=1 Tax=Martelella alba TaxID=2590451 RepID=A0ABY2SDV9_9HYPH|nr:PrgH/EprH family type III secretion apparatus protein [Martelella alba]TKI02797.1 PrgH/EprH family type III secretion apparatus protein [Martelella alba]